MKQYATFIIKAIVSLLITVPIYSGCQKPLSDIIAIDDCLALKQDGTVWVYDGFNHRGQRGAGDKIPITYDIYIRANQVVGPEGKGYLSGIIAVSGDMGISMALKNDGTVWAWGDNSFGQLGNETIPTRRTDKTKSYSTIPVQVIGLDNVKAIVADTSACAALKNDGTVWVWGESEIVPFEGEKIAETYAVKPVQVPGLTNVIAIATAGVYGFALKDDGTVWAWRTIKEFDKGIYKLMLIQLPRLKNIVSISADFGCLVALQEDGTVWAWGTGWLFVLDANPSSVESISYLMKEYPPIKVSGLSDVKAVDVGFQMWAVVIKNDNTVWRFPWCVPHQIDYAGLFRPEQIIGLTDVKATTLGGCYILKKDGTVWKVEKDPKTKTIQWIQILVK